MFRYYCSFRSSISSVPIESPMKKVDLNIKSLVLLAVLAFLTISPASSNGVKVKFVYDGDTILLENGKKVRLLGIDAPEIDHEAGKSEFMAIPAREFNIRLLKNARVSLEYDRERKDHYGRHLAYVFLDGNTMLNGLLLREGLAHVFSIAPNFKHKTNFLLLQRRAMEKRLGIWSTDIRKKGKTYLGNRKTLRFHLPGCPFARRIAKTNVIRFPSEYDAFWEGYSPCRRCRP